MTTDAQLERRLTNLFHAADRLQMPAYVHPAAMARVRRARQRPAIAVVVVGERLSGIDRPLSRRRALLLVGTALLLVAIAALLVGVGWPAQVAPIGPTGWITYVSWDSSIEPGPVPAWSIWRVRADGTDEQQIGVGECPTVSADGKTIAFVSGRLGD